MPLWMRTYIHHRPRLLVLRMAEPNFLPLKLERSVERGLPFLVEELLKCQYELQTIPEQGQSHHDERMSRKNP